MPTKPYDAILCELAALTSTHEGRKAYYADRGPERVRELITELKALIARADALPSG